MSELSLTPAQRERYARINRGYYERQEIKVNPKVSYKEYRRKWILDVLKKASRKLLATEIVKQCHEDGCTSSYHSIRNDIIRMKNEGLIEAESTDDHRLYVYFLREED